MDFRDEVAEGQKIYNQISYHKVVCINLLSDDDWVVNS